jgi:hypothetical protein
MKTKASHTPGPWKCPIETDRQVSDKGRLNLFVSRDTADEPTIAVVQSTRNEVSYEEAESNARLIASAPELLEAAKQAVTNLSGAMEFKSPTVRAAIAFLNAAIAKAEGGAR